MRQYIIGLDIGGTFTDAALLDSELGRGHIAKCLTTPDDPSRGAIQAIDMLLDAAGIDFSKVGSVSHATTLVSNALVERKGAPTGLLTTEGFRDTLHLKRELRYDSYDLNAEFPEPLVPRELTTEVPERVLADGTIWEEIDLRDAEASIRRLVDSGIKSLAVCFLHSYRNDKHEQLVKELVEGDFSDLTVSLSSEIIPEFREFERTSTTVANAYVMPLVRDYLAGLVEGLRRLGYDGELHIMLSSGGITDADTAQQAPIRITESGPAAGALATGFYGRMLDSARLVAFDMGGTSAKASIVDDGQPLRAREFEVARVHRFRKGSGIPLRLPSIDMIEIGAGGGSIARVDRLGLLKVGPDSAGADPGPACYGRGGNHPTVTDAILMLGYVNPMNFAGGTIELSTEAAEKAILQDVADPLGLDVVDAAWGIYRVVTESMASALRVYLAEKGRDPRDYSMVAFGGAGPAHARQVARALHIHQIVCPPAAGVLSAFGLLVAPPAVDLVKTYFASLDEIDWEYLTDLLASLEDQARAFLEKVEPDPSQLRFERFADIRFAGQAHEVTTPVPPGRLNGGSEQTLRHSFFESYESLYGSGSHHADSRIQALAWRVRAAAPRRDVPAIAWLHQSQGGDGTAQESRRVFFPELGGFTDCPIYDRYRLRPGFVCEGPAIVEEHESTAVLGPSDGGRIDQFGNFIITVGQGESR